MAVIRLLPSPRLCSVLKTRSRDGAEIQRPIGGLIKRPGACAKDALHAWRKVAI
jgi:hypothetical protein